MKLSEAIREWKRNITTNMAVEYVLTLRADINAFSDAAQALEMENAKLRELVMQMRYGATWTHEAREYIEAQMRELGIEVPQ